MTVQVEELDCLEGTLGILTLDAPESANALSRAMTLELFTTLNHWAGDARIRLVLIRGSGDRAFCSGTHLRELQQCLAQASPRQLAADQLAPEYRLLYLLHRFPKPVIGLAQGAVIGSGAGLLQACRYRLITPDAWLSLPETGLGLFPGAGASWYLNRLPEGLGLFLGLSGAPLNATDALRIGLVDMVTSTEQHTADLVNALRQQRWGGDIAADDNRLYRLLNQQKQSAAKSLPESQLARHEQDIARLCKGDSPDETGTLALILERIAAHQPTSAHWWQQAREALARACPGSLALVDEQLRKGRQMSLRDVLKMELDVATRCALDDDLRIGIDHWLSPERAQPPRWTSKSVRDLSGDQLLAYFDSPWSASEHPLAEL